MVLHGAGSADDLTAQDKVGGASSTFDAAALNRVGQPTAAMDNQTSEGCIKKPIYGGFERGLEAPDSYKYESYGCSVHDGQNSRPTVVLEIHRTKRKSIDTQNMAFNHESTGEEVVAAFPERVKGKTIVVTGASADSLGAETVIALAKGHPSKLVLLGRTASKIEPVIDQVKRISPAIDVVFVKVALDHFESVRQAAADVNSQVERIDYLVQYAGVMALKQYSKTQDGFESQLAINYLAIFLLTGLLLDKVLAAGPGSRIVNVTSDGYKISPFWFDDHNFSDGQTYEMWTGYGQSKTALVLFTRRLAARLQAQNIQAYTVHPGVIKDTHLGDHVGPDDFARIPEVSKKNTGRIFKVNEATTVQQGIATGLVAVLDPSLAKLTGSYLNHCQPEEVLEYARDPAAEQRLWELSEGWTGQKIQI